jgi:cytochrome c peroxidase
MLNRPFVGVALVLCTGAISGMAAGTARPATAEEADRRALVFEDPTGQVRTLDVNGPLDLDNPFFRDLGTNGRTCFSCHRPAEAWSITPGEVRDRFEDSLGLDPIFRSNDGSNCEGADISSIGKRRQAFSLLLSKGLIRIGVAVPAGAEFEIVNVDDPYRCGALLTEASMYRRPLPTTNLRFLATVMWDGRETVKGQAIGADLLTQALDATTIHAQGAPPSPADLQDIVNFELGLFTAQARDHRAGSLTARGAKGGPDALSSQPFCIGINDPLNLLPVTPGACATSSGGLNPDVFSLFEAWSKVESPDRQAIARGQTVFNTHTFVIDDVPGLNGGPADPVAGPIQGGTCTICHDTPDAGNHSISLPLDIGLADASRRTGDLPLYTLENRTTHEMAQTTDPGRAMITGKWADISKFKGPILRGLAARAPYFHNGSAASLDEVIAFYESRFNIGLTARETADLIAFLRAL